MDHVYLLHHLIVRSPVDDDVKLIGVYSTELSGQRAIIRLKNKPGFRDPRGKFHLEAYKLDEGHWTEGFGPGD